MKVLASQIYEGRLLRKLAARQAVECGKGT